MEPTGRYHILVRCFTALALTGLILLPAGCAPVQPIVHQPVDMTQLAIVASNQAPEIRFEGFSRSRGEGALDTMAKVFEGSLQGRELGVLLLPLTLPIGAAVGAALAPSADTTRHAQEALAKDLMHPPTFNCLPDQVVAAGMQAGARWQLVSTNLNPRAGQAPDYRLLADAGVAHVLELGMTRITARGKALDAPLQLQLYAHGRLLDTADNEEILSTDAEYWADWHKQSEWTADHSRMLLAALSEGCRAMGRHIYENVFMLYPFPDQGWHSHFPRGSLGLAPIDPPLGFTMAPVADPHPTLRWQAFPRDSDIRMAPEAMGRVKNVRYDFFLAECRGAERRIVYRREGLPLPEHRIEPSLQPKTAYAWSVRARFELDGRERLTEWSGLALGAFPEFDRHFVPPLGDAYLFNTP